MTTTRRCSRCGRLSGKTYMCCRRCFSKQHGHSLPCRRRNEEPGVLVRKDGESTGSVVLPDVSRRLPKPQSPVSQEQRDIQDAIRWETIRAILRKRRRDLNLTQAALARRMGRKRDHVAYIEGNDKSIANLITMLHWVEALGGSVTIEFPEEGA